MVVGLCLAILAWLGGAGLAGGGPASAIFPAVPVARAAIPPSAGGPATVGPKRVDFVVASLVADRSAIRPGEPWRIGLKLDHDPGWHTYWRNPGDSGLPTLFEPGGPEAATFGPIVWPMPERLAIGPLANYGYEGEVTLAREVMLPVGWQGSGPVRFEVHAQWLVCREVCIPGEARLALDLALAPADAGATPAWSLERAGFDAAAARAPDPAAAQAATARLADDQFELVLPKGLRAREVEFFPYFEGVLVPAADQELFALPAEAGALLRVRAQPDAPALEADAAGLLVADGRPIELRLASVDTAPVVASRLAVATVKPVSAGSNQPGQAVSRPEGSLLSRFGGGTGPAAGATPGAPGNALPGGGGGAAMSSVGAAAASAAQTPAAGTLVLALFGAVAGGLLLNLMPCVFPVIGLKVLSFASASADAGQRRRHAFAFAAGVILSLALLGGLLLLLRGLGQAVGWGFQLQSPVFVSLMALLFVLIALNLFGVFEIGTRLTTIETRGEGSWGHFLAGAVAVLVATPCTAPFMGGAIGFTLSAGVLATLAVFIALGVGMALPYVLFGLVPGLVRLLPRPGPWLEAFRQLLAFPMLATAVWLAWVLILQTGADGGLRLLIAAVLVSFAAWIYGRAQRGGGFGRTAWARVGAVVLVFGLVATAWQLREIDRLADEPLAATGGLALPGASQGGSLAAAEGAGYPVAWQPWSTAAVAAAQASGRPVFVDFTAAWCISCQANKKIALEREVVRRAFVEAEVVTLRADWTRADPAITVELARHGRNGVPLYLFYAAGTSTPRVLPELLTPEIVVSAIAGAPAALSLDRR